MDARRVEDERVTKGIPPQVEQVEQVLQSEKVPQGEQVPQSDQVPIGCQEDEALVDPPKHD